MKPSIGLFLNRVLKPNIKKANTFYLSLVGLLVFFALLSPEKDLDLVQDPVYPLNDQWEVTTITSKTESVSLPYQIADEKKTNHFSIAKTIEEEFEDEMVLRIRASMQDIKVMAKGQVIYESKRSHKGFLTFPEVSMWHFVKLPRDMKGEVLTLDFQTKIDTFQGVINEIYYGTEGALLKDLVSRNYTGLLVGVIMLLTGIASIIVSFGLRKLDDRRLFYIGIFSISASFWMFSELRILQFITGNRFILGGISYFMVPVIGLSIIRYLGIVVLTKYAKIVDLIAVLLSSCFFFLLIAQLLGGIPLIRGLALVNSVLAVVILWVTGVILYESVILKNKRAVKYGLYMSVLVVSQLMEIIVFFTKKFDLMSHFSKLGYALFLSFMLWEAISYFKGILARDHRTKFLEEMAYKDSLVEGNNRAAYERDLDRILDSSDIQAFRLVIIDINQLKLINDVYGHAMGDQAIRRAYQVMCLAYGNIGSSYRLGGDEFACMITEIDEAIFKKANKILKEEIERENEKQQYPFSLAVGSGLYVKDNQEERKKFSAFFHEVDQQMYTKKKRRYSQWNEFER